MRTLRLFLSALCFIAFSSTVAFADSDGSHPQGEKIWKKCRICHTLEEGKKKIGPHLEGLFGRKAGTVSGYKYSKAFRNSNIVWDEETLDKFLNKPKKTVKGTKMSFRGIRKESDRKALIEYLKKMTDAPETQDEPNAKDVPSSPDESVSGEPQDASDGSGSNDATNDEKEADSGEEVEEEPQAEESKDGDSEATTEEDSGKEETPSGEGVDKNEGEAHPEEGSGQEEETSPEGNSDEDKEVPPEGDSHEGEESHPKHESPHAPMQHMRCPNHAHAHHPMHTIHHPKPIPEDCDKTETETES